MFICLAFDSVELTAGVLPICEALQIFLEWQIDLASKGSGAWENNFTASTVLPKKGTRCSFVGQGVWDQLLHVCPSVMYITSKDARFKHELLRKSLVLYLNSLFIEFKIEGKGREGKRGKKRLCSLSPSPPLNQGRTYTHLKNAPGSQSSPVTSD